MSRKSWYAEGPDSCGGSRRYEKVRTESAHSFGLAPGVGSRVCDQSRVTSNSQATPSFTPCTPHKSSARPVLWQSVGGPLPCPTPRCFTRVAPHDVRSMFARRQSMTAFLGSTLSRYDSRHA